MINHSSCNEPSAAAATTPSFNDKLWHRFRCLRRPQSLDTRKTHLRGLSKTVLRLSMLASALFFWCACSVTATDAAAIVVFTSLTCGPSSVTAPGSAACTVQLSGLAPSGGLGIHIASSNAGVAVPTWVVVPANAASVGFTARVSANATAANVTLTGAFNGVSKTFGLKVVSGTAPAPITVSVSPGSASLTVKSTHAFVASVSGTPNTGITWTVTGAGCSGSTCGTIFATGLYTAPAAVPSPANVTVKATSQQDSTKSASATVTVLPASPTPAPSSGTTYYIAPASAGGNDRNDGRSANAPWLSPHHSLNCGDLILAAAGSYDAQYFNVGSWGTVSCPAGNNVAWLKCAQFDTCRISTSSMSGAMWIDRSYWGVQGWEVTTQKGGTEPTCFVVAPNWNNPVEVHHVILANNVANGCQSGGISTANHPGLMIGVDYLTIVGNIAYNSTQGTSQCYTGISVYAPILSDSLPGTHIYLAGNFAWNNFDPDRCAGGPATDGEGLMFDELDASNQGLPKPYAGQVVADNNILIGNGGPGLQVDHNNAGSGPWATVYSRHNTMWGNNHDLTLTSWAPGEFLWGTVTNTHSLYDLGVTNLAKGGGGHPVAGFSVLDSPINTNTISDGWAYSPWGTNYQALTSPGLSISSNNTFGNDPQFANPVVPGVPNCGGYASVTACMAPVIANFTPNDTAAKAYGYQKPSSTSVSDPLFPQWLCGVTNFPAGLVTMGCK